MALFPVQGIFDGDFVVVLAAIDTEDPMSVVGQKIAHHAVDCRVEGQDRPIEVRHNGTVLDPDATVITAGVAPLDILTAGYA
ncbi:MAG: toluene monooxygenase [Acidimicrobiales bacterium]|nr:toluene monooxygenase [Acidimicrobiales bacterium]